MDKDILLDNINKVHTTLLGLDRIKKNLKKDCDIECLKSKITDNKANIYKKGKNFYVENDGIIITINSFNYSIITAHYIKKNTYMFNGLLIKESLSNEEILDKLVIKKVEIWKTNNKPRYWTAITFATNDSNFPTLLSKSLLYNEIPWYVDFKYNNLKYIVLNDNVLIYEIGNIEEKQKVIDKCRELNVPEKMLDWSE